MTINSITGNTLLSSGSFPPARAASTGSPLTPTTGGLLVVDGIQLVAGDRVLCKDESSAVNNGIYAANTGPWTRTTDASTNQQFFSGMAVTVGLGAVNAGLTYLCTTTDDPVVVGTSSITFAAQSTVATATQTATSTTSFLIGTGSKAFTTQAGKAFAVNQWVIVQETSNPANQMFGQVTAYSGSTLTVNVTATGGSGTHADWTIVLNNSPAAAGYSPPVGSGNVTGPGSSTTGHIATFADGTGKVLSDGGAPIGAANTITPSMFAAAAVSLGATMFNGTIVPSVGANALTLAIKTLAGTDPSASDPVWFVFRSATPGSGSYSVIEVTAALSTTVPASSTLGFQNATPGRFWLAAANNAGTVSLAVVNCLTQSGGAVTAISPLTGFGITSITAYGGGANGSGTFYGVGLLSSVPYSVLGFVTYEAGSTLATAGTWNATPSRVELYRPGVPLPGQTIQHIIAQAGSNTAIAGTNVQTASSVGITPSSSANVIRLNADSNVSFAASVSLTLRLSRGSAPTLIGTVSKIAPSNAGPTEFQFHEFAMDFPATLGATTYYVYGTSAGGTATFNNDGGTFIMAEEIAA